MIDLKYGQVWEQRTDARTTRRCMLVAPGKDPGVGILLPITDWDNGAPTFNNWPTAWLLDGEMWTLIEDV